MLGVLANSAGVIIGSGIGLLFRKALPERMTDLMLKGIAICVIVMAIEMALDGFDALLSIFSVALGAVIGELLRIEERVEQLGDLVAKKFTKSEESGASFSQAFVSTTMLFCIGPMAIVGALAAGADGNNDILFSKAVLDGVSSIAFAAALGPGVLLSSVTLFLWQGLFALLSGWVAPFLGDAVVTGISSVGGLLIICISLRMLKVANIKIANLLPAVFLPILFVPLFALLGGT